MRRDFCFSNEKQKLEGGVTVKKRNAKYTFQRVKKLFTPEKISVGS
jgi:hypothetical protein